MNTDYPFGNPEGAFAKIDDLIDHDFVEFDDRVFGTGISAAANDLTVRVLVGAKGSGKTAYLRRLHDGVSKTNHSIYVDPDIGREPPPTEAVLKFCALFEERILTEKWMSLWRCAILRAVVSHLLFAPRLRNRLDARTVRALLDLCKSIELTTETPESIYSAARNILFTCRHPEDFTRFANQPAWDSIAFYLAENMHDLPPCCFFLDSVDEEFGHAPMHWLRAQKGLFYSVMQLLRHQRLGGRLHIIIAIRDHVFSSVLRSEHQNRYRGEPHIRVLDWGWESIRHLLNTKIARLSDEFRVGSELTSGSQIKRWLGHSEIDNLTRNIRENLEDYLIRHTRQLPRDIIQLGNALARLGKTSKKRKAESVPDAEIRQLVSEHAKSFGSEQLKICTNQILSSNIPTEASRYEFSEFYTGNVEYREDIYEDLRRVVRHFEVDAFGPERLDSAEQLSRNLFGEDSDALSVLWQNRLIGYRDNQENGDDFHEVFYSEHNLSEFRLPRDKQEYFLHSCLIDAVGLTSVVARPLVPGKKDRR